MATKAAKLARARERKRVLAYLRKMKTRAVFPSPLSMIDEIIGWVKRRR